MWRNNQRWNRMKRHRNPCACAGKSTTIFHIINTRIVPQSSTLITAVRNAATQALLAKLLKNPKFQAELVIFGQEARLGAEVRPYQLEVLTQTQQSVGGAGGAAALRKGGWSWLTFGFLARRVVECSKRDLLSMPLVRFTDVCSSLAGAARSWRVVECIHLIWRSPDFAVT